MLYRLAYGLLTTAHDILDALQRDLKYLGLWKFAGAVMYLLHEVLGLAEEMMIASKYAILWSVLLT